MKQSAIRFEHVSFAYPDGHEVLHDVSFDIKKGEKVALVGLNGAGKSTLLLHTNGLLTADKGCVYVNGCPVTKGREADARRAVGIVFQNSDDQLFMPTVEADVAFGPYNMGLSDNEVKERVDRALKLTCCSHLRDRAPFHLSGGQKKMVSIATVLSMEPEILVFDEPTSGLDFIAGAQFVSIVDRLPHTILLSSHDISLVTRLCTRAIVMENGAITYDGPTDTLPYPRLNSLNDNGYEH